MRDATVAWGRERARTWLTVLNDRWIGPDNAYVRGNQISIANYLGIAFMTWGEIIRIDFSAYPNIHRWIGNMKQLEHWGEINEALYGFAEAVKDQEFVTVRAGSSRAARRFGRDFRTSAGKLARPAGLEPATP